MGIAGLLPCLKSVSRNTHLKEFAGKRVAVDAYVWLHRSLYTCAQDLCMGVPTDKCVGALRACLPECTGAHPMSSTRCAAQVRDVLPQAGGAATQARHHAGVCLRRRQAAREEQGRGRAQQVRFTSVARPAQPQPPDPHGAPCCPGRRRTEQLEKAKEHLRTGTCVRANSGFTDS